MPFCDQTLGNSKREWEKAVVDYSMAHQLRWKQGCVKKIIEEHYGEISLSDNDPVGAEVVLKFNPQFVASKVGKVHSSPPLSNADEVIG